MMMIIITSNEILNIVNMTDDNKTIIYILIIINASILMFIHVHVPAILHQYHYLGFGTSAPTIFCL